MNVENLTNLLNALTETSVYVIEEDTHRLLYFNRRCLETGRGRAALGVKCHEVWPEVCANCPLDGIGDRPSNHIVCFDPLLKATVDVSANRIMWDGNIRAVVLTATPHRLNFAEEQGLQNIKRMYEKSLVTVFDECVIANLTKDYYVNCQKDTQWNDIPEQGAFDRENRRYAEKMLHPNDVKLFNEYYSREAMLKLFGEGKKFITKRLRRMIGPDIYHMAEFTAARICDLGDDECWCALVFRDIHEEYLLEQQRNLEISQLATAARAAYQMVISVNLTKNTYHLVEYDRFPVAQPDKTGCFDDLIAFELDTVHPDRKAEFIGKFSRQALIDAYLGGERVITMEVPHLGADGNYHWNFTQVVRVDSPYTDDIIEITLSRNIDEERRLQAEALEKERKAKQLLEDALQKAEEASLAKSDFLSRMSHDIRTPMNAIVGMTELAQHNIGDKSKMKDYLSKISRSGAHLLGLINEVLDVSKIESGAAELHELDFDLREFVGVVMEIARYSLKKKKQKLVVNIDDGLHSGVTGDESRLQQILVNIMENASKYTGEGGTVTFSLEELKKPEHKVGTYRFTVEDTGIGMKPEYLEHIFEPFSRADDSRISKINGTGLGMTIVKNIVAMMGGTIEVESEYGKGSRFIITLCLTKRDGTTVSRVKETAAVGSLSELRVLLVEDNELNRQIATEMIELLGASVETAEDGKQAVEAVSAHEPLYYDIVLMDIQMPVMNGYDAARAIRGLDMARIDELPIVAMTADAFAEDAKRALLSGMNGHLPKPISVGMIERTLSDCLVWKHGKR